MFFSKKNIYFFMLIALLFLNLAISAYLFGFLKSTRFSLKSCQGTICPYAQKLVDSFNHHFSFNRQACTFYTANFEENDDILIPRDKSSCRILWLGSRNNLKLDNLEHYTYILASTPRLHDFLTARNIESYYFPVFSLPHRHKKSKNQIIAVIGNPPFISDILQRRKIFYRQYQLNHIDKIIKDMPLFKAAFVENTYFNHDSLDLHPVFLEIAEAGVPIFTYWGWPQVQEPINLFNDTINFFMFENDAKSLVSAISSSNFYKEISQQAVSAKKFVQKRFSLNAAIKRFNSILKHKKNDIIPPSTLNTDIQAAVGHVGGGDYWLAKDLNIAFKKLGWDTSICFINSPICFPSEISIILRGEIPLYNQNLSGKYNILYYAFGTEAIFDFDSYSRTIQEMFQNNIIHAAVISSVKTAARLKKLNLPVYYIPQFTNTAKFYPDFDKTLQSDVLFIGNYFPYRIAASTVYNAGINITIYGDNWPLNWAKEPYIDNRFLRKYYSSAKIVLNDAREGMKKAGFISNRVFDVTASGGFLISDYMPEIKEIYGDCIPMWQTEKELIDLVHYYLAPEHESERLGKAKCAYEITLKNFTSDIIAEKFMHIINDIRKEKGI